MSMKLFLGPIPSYQSFLPYPSCSNSVRIPLPANVLIRTKTPNLFPIRANSRGNLFGGGDGKGNGKYFGGRGGGSGDDDDSWQIKEDTVMAATEKSGRDVKTRAHKGKRSVWSLVKQVSAYDDTSIGLNLYTFNKHGLLIFCFLFALQRHFKEIKEQEIKEQWARCVKEQENEELGDNQ